MDLLNRVATFENLQLAYRKAASSKRSRRSVQKFFFHLEEELYDLQVQILSGTFEPGEFRVFDVHDPKNRRICAAPFRDRVLHHAIFNVLEPMIERRLTRHSFACRKGMGTHAAVCMSRAHSRYHPYVLMLDISKFFESVNHKILKALLRGLSSDRSLDDLLEKIIDHSPPGLGIGKGLPIGNLTSQHFANLYLAELDRLVHCIKGVDAYIRYMDDLRIFSRDKQTLWLVASRIRVYLSESKNLSLKERVTDVRPVCEGFPFLGYRVFPGVLRLQHRSKIRFLRMLRKREREYLEGGIDAEKLSRCAAGLLGHVCQASSLGFRRKAINHDLEI